MIDIGNFEIQLDTEDKELLMGLQHLYSTKAGERPLDREFGLDIDIIGMPMDVAKNEYAVEVIEKTERYEPRVEVEEVEFTYNAKEGKLFPKIKLVLLEDEEEEDGD